MKKSKLIIFWLAILAFVFAVLSWFLFFKDKEKSVENNQIIEGEVILPPPKTKSSFSIEEAILKRRSVREYKDEPLSLAEISQILWAVQGITAPEKGGRTVPSAGALYPLEIFLVVKKAENLSAGIYHYIPKGHKLTKVLDGDISKNLKEAALGQKWVEDAAANLVITGIYSRTTKKYGEKGILYVYMEAGHAAQNVYLQAQSLGLGTVAVGGFFEEEVKKLLNLSEENPLYIMPLGKIE